MDFIATISQLTVVLKNDKQWFKVLDNLNLNLAPSETLALLGESGCGKSLTALALMRLLPSCAAYSSEAVVDFEGENLLELPEYLMRALRGRRIAIIFQEPMTALNPVLTIATQLAEALPKHPRLSRLQKQEQLLKLLEDVEISDPILCLQKYPHQLSGGQKQRVVIAMALAAKPTLLIADEPTTALDLTIQAQILTLLKKLQQQYQMSLLLITHDLGVVKAVADRVAVMYAGEIVEQANVADFFSQANHPYSQQLLQALPTFEKRAYQLPILNGSVPKMDDLPTGCRFHLRCFHAFSPCATIKPALQRLNGGEVRCHLFPDVTVLPSLKSELTAWKTTVFPPELLLTVSHLSVYFSNKKIFKNTAKLFKAVNDVSFKIYQGKTLALVGESGSGKTTIGRSIIGLQPISSGAINYRGQDLKGLKGKALRAYRKQVQLIFQDPFSSMNPRMTIADILAEGMLAQGLKEPIIKQKQLRLLEQVNLPKSSLGRYPHQFSGGQRQRICIARALANEPQLLICDEPTSALDLSVQAQILNLLKELQQETGISYLFITHNMSVVSYLADEILVMKEGKIIEGGPAERILKQPLEVYTQQLLASVLSI